MNDGLGFYNNERAEMTQEERNKETLELYWKMEHKRMDIARTLFQQSTNQHPRSNARKLVSMAGELAELAALYEGTA